MRLLLDVMLPLRDGFRVCGTRNVGDRVRGLDAGDQSATVLAEERAASQVLAAGGSVLLGYGGRVGRSRMLGGAALATALGGWWLARRALRSLDRLVFTVEAIGPADLTARVDVTLRSGSLPQQRARCSRAPARWSTGWLRSPIAGRSTSSSWRRPRR